MFDEEYYKYFVYPDRQPLYGRSAKTFVEKMIEWQEENAKHIDNSATTNHENRRTRRKRERQNRRNKHNQT